MCKLQESDKFTLENTQGFPQNIIDAMNCELAEDLKSLPSEVYECAVRHEKFRILKKWYARI